MFNFTAADEYLSLVASSNSNSNASFSNTDLVLRNASAFNLTTIDDNINRIFANNYYNASFDSITNGTNPNATSASTAVISFNQDWLVFLIAVVCFTCILVSVWLVYSCSTGSMRSGGSIGRTIVKKVDDEMVDEQKSASHSSDTDSNTQLLKTHRAHNNRTAGPLSRSPHLEEEGVESINDAQGTEARLSASDDISAAADDDGSELRLTPASRVASVHKPYDEPSRESKRMAARPSHGTVSSERPSPSPGTAAAAAEVEHRERELWDSTRTGDARRVDPVDTASSIDEVASANDYSESAADDSAVDTPTYRQRDGDAVRPHSAALAALSDIDAVRIRPRRSDIDPDALVYRRRIGTDVDSVSGFVESVRRPRRQPSFVDRRVKRNSVSPYDDDSAAAAASAPVLPSGRGPHPVSRGRQQWMRRPLPDRTLRHSAVVDDGLPEQPRRYLPRIPWFRTSSVDVEPTTTRLDRRQDENSVPTRRQTLNARTASSRRRVLPIPCPPPPPARETSAPSRPADSDKPAELCVLQMPSRQADARVRAKLILDELFGDDCGQADGRPDGRPNDRRPTTRNTEHKSVLDEVFLFAGMLSDNN